VIQNARQDILSSGRLLPSLINDIIDRIRTYIDSRLKEGAAAGRVRRVPPPLPRHHTFHTQCGGHRGAGPAWD